MFVRMRSLLYSGGAGMRLPGAALPYQEAQRNNTKYASNPTAYAKVAHGFPSPD
jgi:hypothetical protein